MKIHKIMMVLAGVILLAACDSGITTVGNPGGGSSNDDTLFYDAVLEVTPSFTAEGSPSELRRQAAVRHVVNTDWESGNPVYDIFYILRDFNPDTDQGVIDTSNIYKTMWEAKGYFSDTKTGCTAVTEQMITPPFDFGNAETTYNCAFNQEADNGYDFGGAFKEIDDEGGIVEVTDESRSDETAPLKYGLFGFVWVDDHNEYGVIQGSLDSSTEDLSIDIAVWVDYADEDDYCYRNDIDGNGGTHEFTFRSVKGNRVEGSNYLSIVGSGVSQGEGEYFLLKMTGSGLDTSRYYCIGAEDGEAELEAMDAEGSETVDANCAAHQETVDALTFLTTDDLACETSDFNPGGTGTAAEGTIFLNFE